MSVDSLILVIHAEGEFDFTEIARQVGLMVC